VPLTWKLGTVFEHSSLGLAAMIMQTELRQQVKHACLSMCARGCTAAVLVCGGQTGLRGSALHSCLTKKKKKKKMFNISNWYSVNFIWSNCFVSE
jgi:hypothetical protein